MEDDLLMKHRRVHENKWVSMFNTNTPIWMALMHMLRPMDIVSLARATLFYVCPAIDQMPMYMKWWRQSFYNMRWVEGNGLDITIIGKDLVRLNYALERWHYFNADEMRLLVVAKGLPASATQEKIEALTTSIDTSYTWGLNGHEIPNFNHNVQMCVIFLSQNFCVDLAASWSLNLLEPCAAVPPLHYHGVAYYQNSDQTVSPLPEINPLPAGLRVLGLDRDPVSDPWFRAWYVNLRLPDFMIDASITRADLTIDEWAPNFNYRESGIRLAITEDGSVVVPTIPEHVLYTRSMALHQRQ